MTTNRNTNFVYIKDNVSSAASNQFIKFVDKTPRRAVLDSINLISDYELAQQEIQQEEESDTDIRLNLLVEATPDASMKIVMDPSPVITSVDEDPEISVRNFITRLTM